MDLSWPNELVIRSLNRNYRIARKPTLSRGNRSEYIPQALTGPTTEKSSDVHSAGKPTQNVCVERYSRTVQYEWLELKDSTSVEHAQYSLKNGSGHTTTKDPDATVGGVHLRYKYYF